MTVAFLTWPVFLVPCLLAIALELVLGAGGPGDSLEKKLLDQPMGVLKKYPF